MSVFDSMGTQKEVKLAQGTIRYRETGQGEPILFIHGFLVNSALWRKVVPELAKNFRCIAPDLPLGGHSIPMEANTDMTPPGVAKLIADFMAALDLKDVTLVGNDSGGALSQVVITRHPERIKRLVLTNCDCYKNFVPPLVVGFQLLPYIPGSILFLGWLLKFGFFQKLFGKIVAKYPIEKAVLKAYFTPIGENKEVRRDTRKFIKGISNRYTQEAAAHFKDFNKPVLIAWAKKDWLFTRKYAERLAKDFPLAKLAYVENSWAFVPEDQPKFLVEQIEAFMGK
jgi:pimeloyl-ACP methyl ester carboxylesterase